MVGRAADAEPPTASEYLKYVSIDATTMRASTVIRSIPTSETRTHCVDHDALVEDAIEDVHQSGAVAIRGR